MEIEQKFENLSEMTYVERISLIEQYDDKRIFDAAFVDVQEPLENLRRIATDQKLKPRNRLFAVSALGPIPPNWDTLLNVLKHEKDKHVFGFVDSIMPECEDKWLAITQNENLDPDVRKEALAKVSASSENQSALISLLGQHGDNIAPDRTFLTIVANKIINQEDLAKIAKDSRIRWERRWAALNAMLPTEENWETFLYILENEKDERILDLANSKMPKCDKKCWAILKNPHAHWTMQLYALRDLSDDPKNYPILAHVLGHNENEKLLDEAYDRLPEGEEKWRAILMNTKMDWEDRLNAAKSLGPGRENQYVFAYILENDEDEELLRAVAGKITNFRELISIAKKEGIRAEIAFDRLSGFLRADNIVMKDISDHAKNPIVKYAAERELAKMMTRILLKEGRNQLVVTGTASRVMNLGR